MRYTKIVPYDAHDMFQLVLDVSSYEKFLPGISKSVVYEKKNTSFYADLFLVYPKISYRSVVFYRPGHIQAKSTTFPLNCLQADWFFKEKTSQQCQIIFQLQVSFKFPFIRFPAHPFIESMMNAFEKEAHKRYGLTT